jgi:hypothetical protein
MAVAADIQWYKGEDVLIPLQLSGLAPGTNITNWSIQFSVRVAFGAASLLITKTVGSGIVITDPINWLITISVADGDTSGLTPGGYVYDVSRTDAGSHAVLAVGNLQLLPEVTV